jgi:uncharacterized protein YfaS (alpha-2-macroglobulin family)
VGDRILVTYHVQTNAAHSHLELEDPLPACLETINPAMPPIAERFPLPIDAETNSLKLSHVELRYARTLLYFEKAPPGRNVYMVMGKVIVPGKFSWPAAEVRPMYDQRFLGTTVAGKVHVE